MAIYQQLGKHNVRATLALHDALNSCTSRIPEWTNHQLHQEQLVPAARREVCVTPILYLAIGGKEMLDNTGMKRKRFLWTARLRLARQKIVGLESKPILRTY
jgi:hypothetical protein